MLRSIGVSPEEKKQGYGGKDLQKMKVLSLECKSGGVRLYMCAALEKVGCSKTREVSSGTLSHISD